MEVQNNVTSDTQNKAEEMFNNVFNEINTSEFNQSLEIYKGTKKGSQLKKLLDEVIMSNKKEDRKITVQYLETETQDTEQIKNLKISFEDTENFEITFDYDEEKYINKVTIERYQNNEETNAHINNVMNQVTNSNNQQYNEGFNQVNQFINETMNQFNN